ncbi:hypothetical protein RJ55_00991 [Drechmeria coniospora]|nr:hypothetical protein RJ55_00991 [Drechmeria coniospora]
MRALWEQGFYGKGSLSRSEPNWLKREEVRLGLQETHVSEILTVQRRQERAEAKWERARLEQEAIQSTRLEEARRASAGTERLADASAPARAPTGPLELLSLPNSDATSSAVGQPAACQEKNALTNGHVEDASSATIPTADESKNVVKNFKVNGTAAGGIDDDCPHVASTATGSSDASHESVESKSLRRQKSVRFSRDVESNTFQSSDPPSPHHSSAANGRLMARDMGEEDAATEAQAIVNKEHLQLTTEEAFFLAFGLGALRVTDPLSGAVLPARDMLRLFRQHSYFPPRVEADDPEPGPDDTFLLHYVVYHHFRSLGWVPRAGIKFGVDWLLYTRGPVFDHAEFGLIVIPSYSDAWWRDSGKQAAQKTWHWLHSTVRVLSHATKSLVLVYVDVPARPAFDDALEKGISSALALYKVREVMVKRWSSNRNR